MKTPKDIILASSSPYRQQQLRQIGLTFTCLSPNINEMAKPSESIQSLVERLSYEKAQRIQVAHPNSIIIGSDQSAELDGIALTKPHYEHVAFEQLSRCSGKTVIFHTGLCVLAPNQHPQITSVMTEVEFRPLTENQIRSYIQRESPLSCAGSFKCEGLGITLFNALRSSDPSALIGLPLIRLTQYLYEVGVDVITASPLAKK